MITPSTPTPSTPGTPATAQPASTATAIRVDDAGNARILAVAEDRLVGFQEEPLRAIADASGVPIDTVITRVRAMLDAGVIRRVRQTVLSTSLAPGALVAWQVPDDRLSSAFDFMSQRDPFSGHVVIRSADPATPGAQYKLWTTLKVPQGYSLDRHCELLVERTGATAFRLMPAKMMFTLGVGHVRRRGVEPGSMSDEPGDIITTSLVELSDLEWRVLPSLKREFDREELVPEPWRGRAAEAGVDYQQFLKVGRDLDAKGVIGRFSTFLEHSKNVAGSGRVTRFNALFHWKVPAGREVEAGREVGRFDIMTHAYWREGGPEFRGVNIMGVAHGLDKDRLLEHKQAIDAHLASRGISVSYTNVFWGGRSEIKPSEILPEAYRAWCEGMGVEAARMRAKAKGGTL